MKRHALSVIFIGISFIMASWITSQTLTASSTQAADDKYIQLAAVPALSINRIELYFENRRPDITIKRNEPVNVFADIKYTGSGLLQGYWEVDGRILSYVNQHVIFGNTVTLQTPNIPLIPTFDTGTHSVKFVITSPPSTVPLPSILYFVVPSDYAGKPVNINLITPKQKSVLDYMPVKFEWEKFDSKTSYSLQFFKDPKGKPVFSICLFDTSFTLPRSVLETVFMPGEKYYWKIAGCSTENKIGESQMREFTFKK